MHCRHVACHAYAETNIMFSYEKTRNVRCGLDHHIDWMTTQISSRCHQLSYTAINYAYDCYNDDYETRLEILHWSYVGLMNDAVTQYLIVQFNK